MTKPKPKAEPKRVMTLVAILAALAAVWLVVTLRGAGLAGGGGKSAKIDYQPHALPRLQLAEGNAAADSVSGGVRNPFTFGAPPTPTPAPQTPTPTRPPVQRTPPPTPTPRRARGADGQMKPPPPPFDREYLGHFGPIHLQVAAFRKRDTSAGGTEVEVATVGEVLDGVYIVRDIGLESVQIGFVGYDRSEDTRVPLSEK